MFDSVRDKVALILFRFWNTEIGRLSQIAAEQEKEVKVSFDCIYVWYKNCLWQKVKLIKIHEYFFLKKETKMKLEPRNLTNLNFVRLEETQVGDTHGFLQNVTDEIIDDNLIHKIF